MAQPGQNRGKYTLKTFNSALYTWSPDTSIVKRPNPLSNQQTVISLCTAYPGTEGQDGITTYVYNIVIKPSGIQKIAYVACDYVE